MMEYSHSFLIYLTNYLMCDEKRGEIFDQLCNLLGIPTTFIVLTTNR